ncbi:purine-nucleoside phosphorylase [Chengkuizengella axinellae]|uniref:Purine nucleoside phosphorylase n=1 Tax=Chengkuizengella axinellae TaxID=3064388 RepID=A0ABT9IWH4_9BACL|nr:purine-nucleoside phosphorylase [Chengkuizengella sp. 2205SS18-9]MDP5273711.1 purine-nucleoside phosphorylase [Chengkuizengella sp. 2205SS18-9]
MGKEIINEIKESAQYIKDKLEQSPEVGLVLGSGLGVLADQIEEATDIPYEEIPHFPVSTVEGHDGKLVIGKLEGKNVLMMKGRFHMYEGYSDETVSFPIRVMKELGIKTLIVTNAAGGVNTLFEPGNLMLIHDHINFTGKNPLIGPNDSELGVRFPDMSEAYSKRLRVIAEAVSSELSIKLQQGVYIGLLGPSYETPAEIRMLRVLGADAVGMSTVPEVIAARHAGIEVLGISCISNMAAGILDQPLSHDEVMETTEKVKEQFLGLVKGIIPKL